MDAAIARVRSKLTELQERNTQFGVFSSSTYRYLLKPCMSEQQEQETEARYGISLPEDYRRLLAVMGDGGAGPHYAIFSLESSLRRSVQNVRFLQWLPHVQA